jgi:hypothetical protein
LNGHIPDYRGYDRRKFVATGYGEVHAVACSLRTGILSMVFERVKSARTRWRVLRGSELIAKVITRMQFKDGVEVQKKDHQKIAA